MAHAATEEGQVFHSETKSRQCDSLLGDLKSHTSPRIKLIDSQSVICGVQGVCFDEWVHRCLLPGFGAAILVLGSLSLISASSPEASEAQQAVRRDALARTPVATLAVGFGGLIAGVAE